MTAEDLPPLDPEDQAEIDAAFAIDGDAANATAQRVAALLLADDSWRNALTDLLMETRNVPFVEAVSVAAAQIVVDYIIRAEPPGLKATVITQRLDKLIHYAGTLKTRGAKQVEDLNARDRAADEDQSR